MHRYKRGTAESGPGGRGGPVKSREQAIAIGLSKARKKGKKVPRFCASFGIVGGDVEISALYNSLTMRGGHPIFELQQI
jgi:Family of unknown function (DUF6496)